MNNLGNLTGGGNTQANQGANQQNEDYLDKAVDAVEKKQGVDSQKNRAVNEKVTDTARSTLEKLTGKHAPEKFSN